MSAQTSGQGGTPLLENIRRDVRYAGRTLWRDAGFVAFAILIVGLGIGASCTVFSVVNTLLIRPLPFRDPGRLVWMADHEDATRDMSAKTTQVDYLLDYRTQNQSFEDMAAYFAFYGVGDAEFIGDGEPERLTSVPVSPRRFVVELLGGFAGFALVLASLGIYAVISYSVSQRTQEIGIRMALGASAETLQRSILLQTLGLAGIGMIVGVVASWALARTLSGLLFGVTASDPVTSVGMLVILTAVAAIAGYLPARRASRIDPMSALRMS